MHLALKSSSHTPAWHRLWRMWSSYSWRKYFSVESTGLGAVPPNAQSEASLVDSASSIKSSMSLSLPFPSLILVRILSICLMPSRHGEHLPHDSVERNLRKYFATSIMQVSSSITIMPPEPMMAPTLGSSSKSTSVSKYCGGMHPPDGPPVWTALNFLPPGTPPPSS